MQKVTEKHLKIYCFREDSHKEGLMEVNFLYLYNRYFLPLKPCVMKTNRISQAILGLFILATLCFGCNSNHVDSRFKILVDSDLEGEKYTILDTATDSLIYDGGYNPITLDTVISGTYIFYEHIITEEFFAWLVTYNPDKDILMRAHLNLGKGFDEQDWERLTSLSNEDLYEIESLDIANRTISVRLLNGSLETLDLKGEKYGNYWVEYDVDPNTMIADTLILSPTDTIITTNNSIHGKVFYKGRFIAEPYITSKSFKGIDNPEIYILAPTDKVWFETEGDELVANTGMFMNDTDCGYWTEIRIDSTGRTSLSYIVNDENMGD